MPTEPLISVVISYFNQLSMSEALCNNIESYLAEDMEILLMDDCSTDGSESYLQRRFANRSNVKIIRQKKNIGVLKNATAGMAAASGTYLIFSAGDDFLNPSAVNSLRKRLQSKADIYIFQGLRGPREILESLAASPGNTSRLSLLNGKIFETKWRSSSELLDTCAVQPAFIWTQGVMFRTEVAKAAGFMPDGGIDDWGLWHNLACLNAKRPIKIEASQLVLGMVSETPGSLGSDHFRQIDRQIVGIMKYWAPQYQNEALINAATKKINGCRGTSSGHTAETLLRIADRLRDGGDAHLTGKNSNTEAGVPHDEQRHH